ncbi:unnamed protein product [Leptosia nina]|uniref:Nucleolar pre-ribosomal-associated protein 1 n=1 Tax=Leptosia nina TaxID=320188 RepID=A0AAV1JLL6_9NEOP
MGKRKYNDDTRDSPKRLKKANAKECNEENEELHSGKTLSFDIKHFRKELAEKQGQIMALTQFLQVCLNPDSEIDYLAEYLRIGGNSHEILRQITAENRKNLPLATPAFHIFHLIILKVQSSMPHMIAITEEASRYFLNTFIPTIEIMISENSGPRHRKIIINLLTSMVTLSADLGVEVLNQVPLTPKHLQYIVEKPNYKEKDNVRTAFVHFITSFLVEGNFPLIKALLEKQGLLPLVIPGLVQDESEAVIMFLNILKKNVIENNLISKTLKLKTFNHQALHNLFKVFNWKGPPELSNEARNEARPDILALVSNIILTLFTSHKVGLYFVDPYFGTGDTNKNQHLYKAVLSLKRPWENSYECDTILNIILMCPDLHRAVIHVIETSFQPQHSPIWERATEFTIKLLDKLKAEDMLPRLLKLNTMQTVNFIRFVTLPVPLLKLMHANIGADKTISLYCAKVLVKMLSSLKKYMSILGLEESDAMLVELKSKLEYFLPKHVPAPSVIVSLIDDVTSGNKMTESSQDYKLPEIDTSDSLLILIELLLLYNTTYPSCFQSLESDIDMKAILDFTKTITSGQMSLLKFKTVLLWQTLDQSVLSLKNPLFKSLFLIMLEVFTSVDDDTWIEAKDTLYDFLKNTEIYETDEDEIHLMLYTLRNAKVEPISLVADIVEYVLLNKKELIDYMRTQMSNFEIKDESNESNLDQLFNDLMNNKNSGENMFLENKMPSPFIVGCIQYIQGNKEAKKSLKSFLSLYISHLLHSNYSPELSEVLIGDSKLDVRGYVTASMSNLVTLTGTPVEDDILLKISDTIINNADFENILTPIEDGSEDKNNIIIDNKYYKITIKKFVDGSELIIWSKYLMFCIVRLSEFDQLTEERSKKILVLLNVIFSLGKKLHLIGIYRSIVLNLFKNANILKIYRAIDTSKSSYIIATDLMLQIITQNKETMSYLDKKHFLLKSYRIKTYNELMKAFIKISKRKNVNCDHTIKVLETVGLSKDDDVRILKSILSTQVESCMRDDKEPSLVLEVLKVIIDKYSSTATLELHTDIVHQIIELYCNILTYKDVTANLTNLEISLTNYFVNKPHQVICIKEDHFRRFFQANTLRKTTTNLAATMLKLNAKLFAVFEEEANRPEILSQRELTLPLGNAVLDHIDQLSSGQDFLGKLYEEYKTNIHKYLEKPHKAGQVYVNGWRLLKKLIIEFMPVADCQKLLSKIHKFEILDRNHIILFQNVLFKIYVNRHEEKVEYFCNYISSIMHLVLSCVKEEKLDSLEEAISITYKSMQIIKIKELNDTKGDYKKVIDSATWKNFCKVILKNALRIETADENNTIGPKMLCLLTLLIEVLYSKDHEDIIALFDMVTSHSEFLNVMLSYHSLDMKARLLQFLLCLITLNNTVMKPQQIPVFLSAYHATTSASDRLILSILEYYESSGLPVNEYKPYIWGDTAANYYAVRKKRSASLWSHPTPNQVLNLFDREIVEKSIRNFPVNQKLDYRFVLPSSCESLTSETMKTFMEEALQVKMKVRKRRDNESALEEILSHEKREALLKKYINVDMLTTSHRDDGGVIYDPAFILPLLSHLLAPGSMASCFKVMRTGLLSVTVMGLSSNCPMMRAAAYHVLHRYCLLLELETRHKNDKLLLTDFITTLKQSLRSAVVDPTEDAIFGALKNPRLPVVGALYLASALTVCTAPSDPMYSPVNNFLIAKQFVDFTVVPDFLSLFHDNEVETLDRRLWILDIIACGTRSMTDVNVVFKTMCLKMVMDFFTTVLCDRRTKVSILNLMTSLVAIPKAFKILVEGYSFLSWMHSIIRYIGKDDKTVIQTTLKLLQTIVISMNVPNVQHNKINDAKSRVNAEHDVLSVICELLHNIDAFDSDEVTMYIKLYNLLSKSAIKSLHKRQFVNIISKSSESLKEKDSVQVILQAANAGNSQLLKSNIIKNDTNCLVRELHRLTVSHLA